MTITDAMIVEGAKAYARSLYNDPTIWERLRDVDKMHCRCVAANVLVCALSAVPSDFSAKGE